MAVDLDGREDAINIFTKHANGLTQDLIISREENSFETTRQMLSEATGLDLSRLPEHGTLIWSSDYTKAKPEIRYAYNPTYVDVDGRTFSQKVEQNLSRLDKRYYGSKGLRTLGEDMSKGSNWVKAGGIVLTPFNPAAGIALYEAGALIDDIGTGAQAYMDFNEGKVNDGLIRAASIGVGQITDKAINLSPANKEFKFFIKATKDKGLDEIKDNTLNDSENKNHSTKGNGSGTLERDAFKN